MNTAIQYEDKISRGYLFWIIGIIAGIALYFKIHQLFFFDEDIFVANKDSVFMQDLGQRSFVLKFSYIVDNFIGKKNPAGYHITNLLLHFANAVLTVTLLREIMKLTGARFNNLQLALTPVLFFILFLLSPIHSEPLCYILGRCGSAVSFFCISSMLLFLRSRFTDKWMIGLSLLCFILALFSYELSWLFPFSIAALSIFISYSKKESILKQWKIIALYFLVFAAWFVLKIFLINKMLVSDYDNNALLQAGVIKILKNNGTLLLRNFIPPFKSTMTFIIVSVVFVLLCFILLIKVFRKSRPVFSLLVLLQLLTVLAFFPACLLGINSHNSESERYVYYSSVFAIMFLSVLITTAISQKQLLFFVAAVLGIGYSFFLFRNISYYNLGGSFLEQYLKTLDRETGTSKNIFILNQPAQYNGALLMRARSRFPEFIEDNRTVLNEYMRLLHGKDSAVCTTLSTKAMDDVPGEIKVVRASVDSIQYFFPAVKLNKMNTAIILNANEQYPFEKNNSTVAGLKNDSLYIFK